MSSCETWHKKGNFTSEITSLEKNIWKAMPPPGVFSCHGCWTTAICSQIHNMHKWRRKSTHLSICRYNLRPCLPHPQRPPTHPLCLCNPAAFTYAYLFISPTKPPLYSVPQSYCIWRFSVYLKWDHHHHGHQTINQSSGIHAGQIRYILLSASNYMILL